MTAEDTTYIREVITAIGVCVLFALGYLAGRKA